MKDFASEVVIFPLVSYFDEKFNVYVTDKSEFLELIEHFNDYKPLVELDASNFIYPVAIHFDTATKTYTIEQNLD